MAREPPVSDEKRSADPGHGRRSSPSKSGLLNRRRYLKLAGLTTAVGAFSTATATAAGYDVIELDPGEHWSYKISDGETFENVLIDMTAKGASAQINARGPTDWTIRNVGFKGQLGRETRAIIASDEGRGNSRVENVYMGDGVEPDAGDLWEEPALGVWISPDHNGTLTFERCYVQGARDNGFYASQPGAGGSGGDVNFINCKAKNNRVSNFRTGGGVIRNCVAVNDEAVGYNPRPLWVHSTRNTDGVFVYDSDFDYGAARSIDWSIRCNSSSSHLELNDSRYNRMNNSSGATVIENNCGSNPRDRWPEGCPQSAEEAASGGSSSGGSPTPQPSPEPEGTPLQIEGVGEYRIEVDGAIEPASSVSRWLARGDAYDNADGRGWADWWLTGSETEWLVDGEITSIDTADYEGDLDLTFYWDGVEFDPEDGIPSSSSLRIEGVGEYRVEVDGAIEPDDSVARWLARGDAYDNADGQGWADWWLTGSETEWQVTGDLSDIQIEAYEGELDLTFLLDGEEIDPAAFGDSGGDDEQRPSRLEIEGVGEYEFVVDGAVEPAESVARWLPEGEAYENADDEGRADWWLTGSETEWLVTGDLTDVELAPYNGELDLTFRLDGEEIDLEEEFGVSPELTESTLEIEGVGEYRIEVDGSIEPGSSVARWLTRGTAYGNADGRGWADWWLTGSETEWLVTGDIAAIETADYQGNRDLTFVLDGEEIDPADL